MFHSFAITSVLLSLAALSSTECAFTLIKGVSIESKFTLRIPTINTLEDCLLFLEQYSESYAAVSYNDNLRDCCTVAKTSAYELVERDGWSTYYIDSESPPDVGYPSSQAQTTRATTTRALATEASSVPLQTSRQSDPPVVEEPNIFENMTQCGSTTVDGITITAYGWKKHYYSECSWSRADWLCKEIGMELAQLTTQNLFQAAVKLQQDAVKVCDKDTYVANWVGGKMVGEDNYVWTSNQQSLNPQPVNGFSQWQYVYLWSSNYYATTDSFNSALAPMCTKKA